MKAKAFATLLAAMTALVLLALPTGAGAARTYHQGAQVYAQLSGAGTHGFRFILFTFDQGAVFSLQKINGKGEESVSYVALKAHLLGGLDRGRLDLEVGKLGHFRGHLVATKTKRQKLEQGCKGDPTIVEEGHFVGSFVFHGERGYTTIQAPRLTGSIARQGATECQIPATEPGSHGHKGTKSEEESEKAAEEDEFHLLAGDREAGILLQASREQVPSGPGNPATTTFQVSVPGGRAGAFQVSRSAAIFDTEKDAAASFVTPNLAEPLAEATLEPPAPFSGSATFRLEGPKTASWTGDLAVELPGGAKLPLTGKKIDAGACRGRSHCTKTLPKPLQRLLELDSFGVSYFVSGEATTQTS